MNLGINNSYQYGPSFGKAIYTKKGLSNVLSNYIGYQADKDYVKAGLEKASTSQNADLVINRKGCVFVGLKEGNFCMHNGDFKELDTSNNTYRCKVDDKKNKVYELELKFDSLSEAEKLNHQIYGGQTIARQTVTLFNAIEDGASYTIKRVTK